MQLLSIAVLDLCPLQPPAGVVLVGAGVTGGVVGEEGVVGVVVLVTGEAVAGDTSLTNTEFTELRTEYILLLYGQVRIVLFIVKTFLGLLQFFR